MGRDDEKDLRLCSDREVVVPPLTPVQADPEKVDRGRPPEAGVFYYLPWPPKDSGGPFRWAFAAYLDSDADYPVTHLSAWRKHVVPLLTRAWELRAEQASAIIGAKASLPRGRVMVERIDQQRRHTVYHGADAPSSRATCRSASCCRRSRSGKNIRMR